MSRFMVVSLGFVVSVGLLLPTVASAQRIDIGNQGSDTVTKNNNEQGTPATSRIIPPEQFGKYKNQKEPRSQLSRDALLEKLRADSASMRIHFQETVRDLKADSRLMRKKIEKLKRTLRALRVKLRKVQGTGQSTDTGPGTLNQDTAIDLDLTGTSGSTAPADPSATPGRDRMASGDTPERSGMSKDASLNPNSASLGTLKAVPGLSDRLAERLEWYRREVRPFETLEDLKRVPGIDEAIFNEIKPYFSPGPY